MNKTGEISVPDLGNWKPEKEREVVKDGQSSFKLIVPDDNIHAKVKLLEVKAGFDVMKPEFRTQIKVGLSQ